MSHRGTTLAVATALLLGVAAALPQEADPTASTDTLRDDVERIAARVARTRGGAPPHDLRVSRATVEERRGAVDAAVRRVPAARLAARGRAWSAIGLGDPGAPGRLLRILAADLEVVVIDPASGRLLVADDVLTDVDFVSDVPDDPASAVFLATGLRPDEPVMAHAVVHRLQRAHTTAPAGIETTDALLARTAWEEGEANLLAIGLVFEGLRMADAVLARGVDPARVLDGRLLPAGYGSLPDPDAAWVEFVYQEGFEKAARALEGGGFRAVASAARGRRTSRDVLHPDRSPLPPAGPPPPPSLAVPEGLEDADLDSLGEVGIVALLAAATGKADLAMAAGDGWTGDWLRRWEASDGEGVTLWRTEWASADDAREFEYGYARALEEGRGGVRQEGPPDGPGIWIGSFGVARLQRAGRAVEIRVASPEIEARIRAAEQPKEHNKSKK